MPNKKPFTLRHIELLIRCYYTQVTLGELSENDRLKIRDLYAERLVEDTNAEQNITTTERAKVYVEAIRALPLPIQSWSMPSISEVLGMGGGAQDIRAHRRL